MSRNYDSCFVLEFVGDILPVLCPALLGNLFVRDSHLICRQGSPKVEDVAFEILAQSDLSNLGLTTAVGTTPTAARPSEGAAAACTASSSSPTRHREEFTEYPSRE